MLLNKRLAEKKALADPENPSGPNVMVAGNSINQLPVPDVRLKVNTSLKEAVDVLLMTRPPL